MTSRGGTVSVRDRVSTRIGEYMLLGATMLNGYCDLCGTVLVRKRGRPREETFCVLCEEVEPQMQRQREREEDAAAEAAGTAHMNGHAPAIMNGHARAVTTATPTPTPAPAPAPTPVAVFTAPTTTVASPRREG